MCVLQQCIYDSQHKVLVARIRNIRVILLTELSL
jgi:hypothetical protein